MKKVFIIMVPLSLIIIFLAWSMNQKSNGAAEFQDLKTEGRATMHELGKSLKGHLVKAMKEGGPASAIEVCNLQALSLTEQVSETTGFEIRRTSLQLRNLANAPTAWEEKILLQFEAEAKQGISAGHLEYAVITREEGKKVFKMMSAIGTAEPCLACHGETLDQTVQAKLRELYPKDLATGFKVGDLRGAFSLRKVLD